MLGKKVTRTHALESLVVLSFLRDLSVRDVEALLEETFGETVVSRSTVSRICEQTRERYRAWCDGAWTSTTSSTASLTPST